MTDLCGTCGASWACEHQPEDQGQYVPPDGPTAQSNLLLRLRMFDWTAPIGRDAFRPVAGRSPVSWVTPPDVYAAVNPTVSEYAEQIKSAFIDAMPGLTEKLHAVLQAFGECARVVGDALTRIAAAWNHPREKPIVRWRAVQRVDWPARICVRASFRLPGARAPPCQPTRNVC